MGEYSVLAQIIPVLFRRQRGGCAVDSLSADLGLRCTRQACPAAHWCYSVLGGTLFSSCLFSWGRVTQLMCGGQKDNL